MDDFGAPVEPTQPPAGGMNERIQALFSRAVEEQVSEQRQLASALTEVRVRLTLLAEEVRGATGSQSGDALTREVSRLGEELRVQIEHQRSALDLVGAKLDAYAGFPSSLSALQDDLAGMHGRLQALGEIKDAVADLAVSLARPDVADRQQVTAATERIVGAVEVLGNRLETVDDIADSLLELHRSQGALAEQVGQLRDRAEDGAGNAGGDAGLVDLPDRVRDVEGRLSGLEEQLRGVGDRLSELTGTLGRLDAVPGQLSGLTDQLGPLSGLGQQIGELRVGLAGIDLAEEMADLKAQLNRLSDRVDAPAQTPGSGPDVQALAALLVNEVRAAIMASEGRLQVHVDEAVLALADALLRRRPVAVGAAAESGDAADEGPGPVRVHRDEAGEPVMDGGEPAGPGGEEPVEPAGPEAGADSPEPAAAWSPSPPAPDAAAASHDAASAPAGPPGPGSAETRRRGLFRHRDG